MRTPLVNPAFEALVDGDRQPSDHVCYQAPRLFAGNRDLETSCLAHTGFPIGLAGSMSEPNGHLGFFSMDEMRERLGNRRPRLLSALSGSSILCTAFDSCRHGPLVS